jgi:hypothetical protein
MNFERFERGYLLPSGCKDLIDVINLQAKPQAKIFLKPVSAPLNQPPATKGDLLVPEHATVRQLAVLLGQKPFRIIADAMQLGVFASANQSLGFEVTSKIVGKYGYVAKRAA